MSEARPDGAGRRWWERACIGISALVPVWFVLPVFAAPLAWGSTRDWGYFTFLEEVTRKSILEFAQIPLWNPYYFGGAEHLANPQTTLLSPTTLLTLMFGTAFGLKLGILLFAELGFAGMYQLARMRGADVAGACMSGVMYGCSGWFAQHVGGGHWGFAAVGLYPWVALLYVRGLERGRSIAAAAVLSAWVAVHWGIYTLPWLFMLLLVVAAGEAIRRVSLAPLGWLVLLALATAGLAAVRLLPVWEYVRQFPRHTIDTDRLGLDAFTHLFLARATARTVPGFGWEWPEYGNYLGWIPCAMLIASVRCRFPNKAVLWSGAAVFLALACGDWGAASPYSLLRRLPLFEHLRVPSRYTLPALFFLAPIAGLAWTRIAAAAGERWHGPRVSRGLGVAGLLLVAAMILDPVRFNRRQFEQSFHLSQPDDDISPSFVQRRGDPNRMYAYPRANQGSVLGLEESPLPLASALWIADGPQHLLEFPAGAGAEQSAWSPNQIRFRVHTPAENLLVVNQNYRPAWKAEGGGAVENYKGLLAVRLPPGEREVVLRYRPLSAVAGLVVSTLTAAMLTLSVLLAPRRAGRVA